MKIDLHYHEIINHDNFISVNDNHTNDNQSPWNTISFDYINSEETLLVKDMLTNKISNSELLLYIHHDRGIIKLIANICLNYIGRMELIDFKEFKPKLQIDNRD